MKISKTLFLFISLTKTGRIILSEYLEFERLCIVCGFDESDRENIREISEQTPRTMSSVANTYAIHKKNKENTLKAIEYSMGCGYL